MLSILFVGAGLLCAGAHLFAVRKSLDRAGIVEIILLYLLVFGVGLAGLFAASGHIFAADRVAASIGWAVGSPFQFEVGAGDLAWGVLGVMCIWFRGDFWLATGLGWSIFLLGACFGHVRETVLRGNFASYNFGMILPDLLLPLLLLGLLFYRRLLSARGRTPEK